MKVYCSECIYLVDKLWGLESIGFLCTHPNNLLRTEELEARDPWKDRPTKYGVYGSAPELMNANNNCPYFKLIKE